MMRAGFRLHFRNKQQKLHLFLMYISSTVCLVLLSILGDAWLKVLRENEPKSDRWQKSTNNKNGARKTSEKNKMRDTITKKKESKEKS